MVSSLSPFYTGELGTRLGFCVLFLQPTCVCVCVSESGPMFSIPPPPLFTEDTSPSSLKMSGL